MGYSRAKCFYRFLLVPKSANFDHNIMTEVGLATSADQIDAIIANASVPFHYVSFFTRTLWYGLWLILVLVNYVLVVLPKHLVNMLQKQFLVTLSLLLILIYLTITASFSYYLVRHKYLTRYSADTAPPTLDKSKLKFDLALDYDAGTRKKRGADRTKNYLDEFLSAIKVFGYLERPVFHELTKNMTTQKLSAGEILYLDEHLGFSIVVEGTVQVYIKMKDRPSSKVEFDGTEMDDTLHIGDQQYQLLNEVKSGAALSSLLSALDLFRSRFSGLSSPNFSPGNGEQQLPLPIKQRSTTSYKRTNGSAQIDPLSLNHEIDSTKHDLANLLNSNYAPSPSLGATFPTEESAIATPDNETNIPLLDSASVYLPEIVARAKPDKHGRTTATIAIIPGLAFQRVQSKYPKATSHIVTMVLTRLYKVTMNTVHNYLGLTTELVESEITLNQNSEAFKLPGYLYDSVKESMRKVRGKSSRPDQSSQVDILSKPTRRPQRMNRENSSRYVALASRSKPTHPGDLLSSVPLSRRADYASMQVSTHDEESPNSEAIAARKFLSRQKHSFTTLQSRLDGQENIRDRSFSDELEETEESALRIAIVENFFKLLGIEDNARNLNGLAMLSGQFTPSSSLVGLSTLMNDNSIPISGERYVYDAVPDEMRFGSYPSLGGRSSFGNSRKVYNTIHQTLQLDPPAPGVPLNSKPSSGSANTPDFTTIKNSFSKYVQVKYYPPNSTLVAQDSTDTGLYYVIDGSLDVSFSAIQGPEDSRKSNVTKKLYTVNSGGLAGYLSCIVGFKSIVSITSSKEAGCIVGYISKSDFTRFMDKFYFLQLPVASKLKSLLPQLIRTIDFALEWCHIPAGGVLCSQGDLANGFHIVLSGRFRVVRYKRKQSYDNSSLSNLIDDSNSPKSDDSKEYEILGEYGHGQSIGEVEVLTASRRTNSLIAVRDSETARIPRTLFEMLIFQNPSIMVEVSRIVAQRAVESQESERYANVAATLTSSRTADINSDYKTITILPSVNGLPVREFGENLVKALKDIGRSVIALDQATSLTHLGRNAFDDRLARLKLSGFFAYMEEKYETVVYICDTPLKSNWTSTCISQGDCILLLADAEDDECATSVGEFERLLIKSRTTARTDLCLIHPEKSVHPGSTSIWLKNRIWVHGHHHIQMEIPKDEAIKNSKKKTNILAEIAMRLASKANPNIKMKFESVRSRAVNSLIRLNAKVNRSESVPMVYKNDFLRLARLLSNEGVGLVLGGGGSRGISHVGVVTALEKHGIPVDLVGGTSIGSFVGGLYAREHNIVTIYGKTKIFSRRIGSLWRSIFDLTYPVTSYITGYEFNRGIWKLFGYTEIEDFWLKYFCNSTNITNSTMEIHETGYAWRFIRASMSLAGLLPPITFKGSMLLDGGYLDNLPVLEMKNRGAKYIIAVDVGSVDDRTPMNYGDTLSGFWVLFNRINPFSKHPNPPNMMDIQLRLAYVASVNALALAKRTPGVIYLRPPIDDYATLDFLKFDEIFNVGLAYADELLTKWETEDKLPKIAGMDGLNLQRGTSRKKIHRRNSI